MPAGSSRCVARAVKPIAGRPCALQFAHRDFAQPLQTTLQTDAVRINARRTARRRVGHRVKRGAGGHWPFVRALAADVDAAGWRDASRRAARWTAKAVAPRKLSLTGDAPARSELAIADANCGSGQQVSRRRGGQRRTARRRMVGRQGARTARHLAPTCPLALRPCARPATTSRSSSRTRPDTAAARRRHPPRAGVRPVHAARRHHGAAARSSGSTSPTAATTAAASSATSRYDARTALRPEARRQHAAAAGLLLNPWQIDDSTNAAVGLGGGSVAAWRDVKGAARRADHRRPGDPGSRTAPPAVLARSLRTTGCRRAALRTNLVPTRTASARQGCRSRRRPARARAGARRRPGDLRCAGEAGGAVTLRSRTLAKALDQASHTSNRSASSSSPLAARRRFEDARAAQVEIHDSARERVSPVFRRSRATTSSPVRVRAERADKKDDEKAVLYREHACHELHSLPVARKDRVLRPRRQAAARAQARQDVPRPLAAGDDPHALHAAVGVRAAQPDRTHPLAQRPTPPARQGIARAVREALELRPIDAPHRRTVPTWRAQSRLTCRPSARRPGAARAGSTGPGDRLHATRWRWGRGGPTGPRPAAPVARQRLRAAAPESEAKGADKRPARPRVAKPCAPRRAATTSTRGVAARRTATPRRGETGSAPSRRRSCWRRATGGTGASSR